MSFRVVVHRHAARYLRRLPAKQQERLKAALRKLGEAPLDQPGSKAMAGEWAGYQRLRIGDLRLIYWVDRQHETVYVDHIGPRGDIYKR